MRFLPAFLLPIALAAQPLAPMRPPAVPLIAHDRAGFGGATATAGLLTFASVWFAAPSRALWEALLIGGIVGWACAVGACNVEATDATSGIQNWEATQRRLDSGWEVMAFRPQEF